jgi:hypothetical protein
MYTVYFESWEGSKLELEGTFDNLDDALACAMRVQDKECAPDEWTTIYDENGEEVDL